MAAAAAPAPAAEHAGVRGRPADARGALAPTWLSSLTSAVGEGTLAETCLGVAMRVPGLFIIDHWWQFERPRALPQTFDNGDVMQALLNNVVLIHGFLLLLLPIAHLRSLYGHLLSGLLLFASHFVSERYVALELASRAGDEPGGVGVSATTTGEAGFLHLHSISDADDRRTEPVGRGGGGGGLATAFDHHLPQLAAAFSQSQHVFTLLCHLAISVAVFSVIHRPSRYLQVLLCVHMLPVLARLASMPLELLPALQTFGDALLCVSVLYYMCYKLPSILDRIKETYSDAVAIGGGGAGGNEAVEGDDTPRRGIDTMRLLSALWAKLFVPSHFVVFWTISVCGKAAEAFAAAAAATDSSAYSGRPLMFALQCASAVCCSPINLLATSVVVSSLSNVVIGGCRLFLGAANEDNPMHSGWTQGLTMLLLGLQTGLMQAQLPGRTLALLVILFIVVSSLLQTVLEITEPVVLSLSASRSLSRWRHAKVLAVCGLLFVLPLMLTFRLATILPIDAWVAMVLSTCVLTSVQVLGMLAVHALFVYDNAQHGTADEAEAEQDEVEGGVDLDDVLYTIGAVTKLLELLVSLFVVAASVYESSTGKWNLANSTILSMHTYYNVYRRIKTGWRSFLLRREASMKTETLATPSHDQLAAYNDVCPICYVWLGNSDSRRGADAADSYTVTSESRASIAGRTGPPVTDIAAADAATVAAATRTKTVSTAIYCITPCKHYFHRSCLKKWLYSQDACPMCHQKIIVTSKKADHDEGHSANLIDGVRPTEVMSDLDALLNPQRDTAIANVELVNR